MPEGTEVGTAYVSVVPSAQGFGATLERQLTGEAGRAGNVAGQALGAGITGQATGIAKGVAGVFAAVGAGRFLKGAVGEAEDAARVGRLTESVIRSTGRAAGVSADQVQKLAASLSKVAGVDDEVIQSAENVLLTFTAVRNQVGKGNDVFNQAAAAALDMSAALGGDLQGAVVQLGKALNDPIQGMTALRRSGVSFTQAQQEQIKALQQSGDLLGAQKIVLGELSREFGGAAAANATATAKFGVAVGNLQESIGTALLPTVNAAAGGLSGMLGVFTSLPGPVQTVSGAFVGLGAAAIGIGLLAPKMTAARDALEGMGRAGTVASRSLSILGKVGTGIVIAGAVLEASDAIGAAITRIAAGPTAPANALTKSLVELGTTGKVTGELAKQLGDNLGQLGEKAAEASSAGGLAGVGQVLAARLNPSLRDSKRDIDSIDKALAGLVSSGHADVAARSLALLVKSIAAGPGGQGAADKFVRNLGDYKEALNGVDTQALLTGTSLDTAGNAAGGAGDKAEEAKKQWDDLRDKLVEVVQSDFSQQLASNLTGALNPLDRFVVGAGANIDALKTSVDSAAANLAEARGELDKLQGTAITDPVEAFLSRGGEATAAQLAAAQGKVDKAAAALVASQKQLADAQKSPLATISDNLTANLAGITSWLGNIDKLSQGGHELLARRLTALGPQAADAVAEAVGVSPRQLDKLQGLFEKADAKIAEAASGAFELNLAQAGKPGETLAEIIAQRYQETLAPKLTAATLAAITEAADMISNTGGVTMGTTKSRATTPTLTPAAAGPGDDVERFLGQNRALAPAGVGAGAGKTNNITVNIEGGQNLDPALIGKMIAWEL